MRARIAVSRIQFPLRRWIAGSLALYAGAGFLESVSGRDIFAQCARACAGNPWIGDGGPIPMASAARNVSEFVHLGGGATVWTGLAAVALSVLLMRWHGAGRSPLDGRPLPDGIYAGLLIFTAWWGVIVSSRWFDVAFLSGTAVPFPDRMLAWLCGPSPWRSSVLSSPSAFCALLAVLHGVWPRYFTAHFLAISLLLTMLDVLLSRIIAMANCHGNWLMHLAAAWPALICALGLAWLRSDAGCHYTAWQDRRR